MSDKRAIDILAISGLFLPFIILLFDIKCIFKRILHIPCISCGLTRAINSIIHLKFLEAIKYNVLSIPLFISIIIFYTLYIINKIFKKDYIYKYYNLLSKNYIILIIILLIGWIINLIIKIY